MLVDDALNIYTDGSSFRGPRAGGIGIIFVVVNDAGDAEIINEFDYPGYREATNNEMELEACIRGLDEALSDLDLKQYKKIELFTDSRYVSDNYTNAMFVWPKTRWTSRATGRAILHVPQWKRLIKLLKTLKRISKTVLLIVAELESKLVDDHLAKRAVEFALTPLNDEIRTPN